MTASPVRPLNRRIATLALLALLWAQALVLGHAVAHAGGSQGQASAAATAGKHLPDGGHASGSAVCRLLDHLLTGQAPPLAAPLLAGARLVAAAPRQPEVPAATGALWRHYNARGPPLS